MPPLTTTQMIQLGAASVVAVLLFGPKIKDGLASAWASITGGDVAGGVQKLLDAIKQSDIVQKTEEVKGTAGNVVLYTRAKSLANSVVDIVAEEDKAPVKTACETLLTAIAKAPVKDDPAK